MAVILAHGCIAQGVSRKGEARQKKRDPQKKACRWVPAHASKMSLKQEAAEKWCRWAVPRRVGTYHWTLPCAPQWTGKLLQKRPWRLCQVRDRHRSYGHWSLGKGLPGKRQSMGPTACRR